MELWLLNALKEKIIIKIWQKNWSFSKITDILLNFGVPGTFEKWRAWVQIKADFFLGIASLLGRWRAARRWPTCWRSTTPVCSRSRCCPSSRSASCTQPTSRDAAHWGLCQASMVQAQGNSSNRTKWNIHNTVSQQPTVPSHRSDLHPTQHRGMFLEGRASDLRSGISGISLRTNLH